MMGQYEQLLHMAFGKKKPEQKADPAGITGAPAGFQPAPMTEEKKQYETRASVSRDQFTPDTVGSVQAFVWKDGTPPPPKPPTAKTADAGTVGALKNNEGWGKI